MAAHYIETLWNVERPSAGTAANVRRPVQSQERQFLRHPSAVLLQIFYERFTTVWQFCGEHSYFKGMRTLTQIVGGSVTLLLAACVPDGLSANREGLVTAEFIGSTPGGALLREFLGGLATNAECHYVKWQIKLSTNQSAGLPATYDLVAQYHVPARNNPNQSAEGPQVTSHGTFEIIKGAKSSPDAVVYRIIAEQSQRSLSFVKVNENLLHLLNPDGSLTIGNGGWSYTLNRAASAEKPVDPSLAMSAPDMSYKIAPLATGPTVFGVFEGRSPCHGIARELKLPQHAGCHKVKWRVTLYQDPKTSAPTTYKVEGTLHRQSAREGTWSIVRGAKTDPNAVVCQLNPTPTEAPLLLLKADDNILFFLNQDREPMVGHAEFSYTLNRVIRK
jgi:hypothetical protein